MGLMSTMEQTLHTNGQNGLVRMVPPTPRKMRWPAEFKRPVDAAIHIGTPAPRKTRNWRGTPHSVEFILD